MPGGPHPHLEGIQKGGVDMKRLHVRTSFLVLACLAFTGGIHAAEIESASPAAPPVAAPQPETIAAPSSGAPPSSISETPSPYAPVPAGGAIWVAQGPGPSTNGQSEN